MKKKLVCMLLVGISIFGFSNVAMASEAENIQNEVVNLVEKEQRGPEDAQRYGWELVDGIYYFLDDYVRLKDQWYSDGYDWYYLGKTGAMLSEEYKTVGEDLYYFQQNGVMKSGWNIFYDSDGEANYTYHASNGVAYKNQWLKDNGKWYYFNYFGHMVTGFRGIGNEFYHFDSTGAALEGWVHDDHKNIWRFYEAGSRYTNRWYHDGYDWYYFDAQGNMVTGSRNINGTDYNFNSNGTMCE